MTKIDLDETSVRHFRFGDRIARDQYNIAARYVSDLATGWLFALLYCAANREG